MSTFDLQRLPGGSYLVKVVGELTGLFTAAAGQLSIRLNGSEVAQYGPGNGRPSVWVPLAVTGASAGVFASAANPFGYDVSIVNAKLVINTQAGLAGAVDAGVAANGSTIADNLIDGLSVNGITGWAAGNAYDTRGTNGLAGRLWGTSQFLNVGVGSGNPTGLVGVLWVECVRAP